MRIGEGISGKEESSPMADAAACDGGGEAGKVERAERSLGSGWRRPRSDLIPRRWSSRGRQMGLARVLELSRVDGLRKLGLALQMYIGLFF